MMALADDFDSNVLYLASFGCMLDLDGYRLGETLAMTPGPFAGDS